MVLKPRRAALGLGTAGLAIAAGLAISRPSGAAVEPPIRPMSSFHDLVAGQSSPGFRDGSFTEALFDGPTGLAISPDGSALWVADTRNHRVRRVDLRADNRVSTLAGSGRGEPVDGPFETAGFASPRAIAALPNGNLVVMDGGGLRLVDLPARRVATLTLEWRGPGVDYSAIFAMAVGPDGSLYASVPERGAVIRVDVATRVARVVPKTGVALERPTALCFFRGRLTVADAADGSVSSRFEDGVWRVVGSVERPRALAAQGDLLLALGADPAPLVSVVPAEPAGPISPWGRELSNAGRELLPELAETNGPPAGIVFDSREERRVIVSSPRLNILVGLREYGQRRLNQPTDRLPDGLLDYRYPRAKPPGSVRLLVAGDSRTFASVEESGEWRRNRMEALSKRMELFLAAEAALSSGPNYQVLASGRNSGEPVYAWAPADLPRLATAYDTDLVVLVVGMLTVTPDAWFQRPLGEDGLPAPNPDGEYLLREPRDRVPPGVARRFFARAEAKDFVRYQPGTTHMEFVPPRDLLRDPELRADLREMVGAPIGILRKRLAPRPLVVAYLPTADFPSDDDFRAFFRECAAAQELDLLDLSAATAAVRFAFHPFAEGGTFSHFTPEGSSLAAWLLVHELARTGRMPPAAR